MSRKSQVEKWGSESLLNYVIGRAVKGPQFTPGEMKIFQDEMMAMHRASYMNGGAIRYHRDRLGQQDYTWIGSSRNWIWESRETSLGTPPRWRMFASKEGCAFELDQNLTKIQVRQAWDDYRRRTRLLEWPSGTRVLCYAGDEPGSIIRPCSKNPDSYRVQLDAGTNESIQIAQIAEVK